MFAIVNQLFVRVSWTTEVLSDLVQHEGHIVNI